MKILDLNKLFFTSDPHYFHKNIIKYANRPFLDVDDMTEQLVKRWNAKVPEDGIVFINGDFAYSGNIEKLRALLARLNGEKHLIFGNHDHQNKLTRPSVQSLFESAHEMLYLEVQEGDHIQGIHLCHYPMVSWNQKERGSWNLFGHIHSGPSTQRIHRMFPFIPGQYDVGVDNNDYAPISYIEVRDIITTNFVKATDYEGLIAQFINFLTQHKKH